MPAESVDLIYLDPPFNSNRDYNVIFEEHNGRGSQSQLRAFEDTWHWDHSTAALYEQVVEEGGRIAATLRAFRDMLGDTDMMAYLANMAPRLVELWRVLKPTGSLYLHCDPTASHYLKVLLDGVFDGRRFCNEVVWERTSAHSRLRRYGPVHDLILLYTRGGTWTWNQQFMPYDEAYINSFYRHVEEGTGRRYRLSGVTSNRPGAACAASSARS